MPEAARFYGIVIKVFLVITLRLIFMPSTVNDALVDIESLEIIGDLPSRVQKLVVEWAVLHQQDLLQM